MKDRIGKKELCERIANSTDMTQKQAAEFLNAFIEEVQEAVADAERVVITGFATFELKFRASREWKNPQNQETVITADTFYPSIKPGKNFREYVRED